MAPSKMTSSGSRLRNAETKDVQKRCQCRFGSGPLSSTTSRPGKWDTLTEVVGQTISRPSSSLTTCGRTI